jgi:aspartate/methionine/tyrosine aminotransferase
MNPIAQQLNKAIETGNPNLLDMLSVTGRALFFPKGILSQSAEAKQKAHKLNATIGIAKENGRTMYLSSVMSLIDGLNAEEALTYAPSFGIPELRKVWRNAIYEKNPSLAGKIISLPVVTCGITHAVSMVADLWADPGDVVILPDMMWGNYNMILNLRRGARISQYPFFNNRGGYNLAAFEELINAESKKSKKIMVLLNYPHNPTGYTVTKKEGEGIADILSNAASKGTRLITICDDSYFGLFYDEETLKESVFALICDRSPNLLAIKVDGATKENFAWGLRVGFITYGIRMDGDPMPVYDALEKKTAGCIRGNISNASHLSQSVVLKSMNSSDYSEEKKRKFDILQRRAKMVKKVLSDTKYNEAWDVYPFNSGYFMCLRLKDLDAETLRLHLLDRYGVGLISVGKRDLRVAFSCLEEADIRELFDTVLEGAKDLKG